MTEYNGFGSATTTGQGSGAGAGLVWQNDASAYTFGQRFRVDTAGLSATKIRFYVPAGSPNGAGSGYRVALYEVGNTTAVATAGPVSGSVGWNEVAITPTALTSGADYVAAALFPNGYYAAQSPNAFPWDPSGPVNFYTGGYYNSGSSLTYPASNSGSDPSYGVDVAVSDGASSNDGSGTPASGATTSTGTGTQSYPGAGTTSSGATTSTGTGTAANNGAGSSASAATTSSGSSSQPITGSGTSASRATTSIGYGTGPVGGFSRTRAELVELLATIPGVVALPYPTGVPAQGQAWPQLGTLDLTSYGQATWHAVFVAGGDGRVAERWLDSNLEPVLDALKAFMYVDTVTPVDLGNNVVGVAFAGRREI